MQPEALRGLISKVNPEIAGVFCYVLLRPPRYYYRRLTYPLVRCLFYDDSSDYRVALLTSNGRIDANQCGHNNGTCADDSHGNAARLTHVSTETLSIVTLNLRIVRCEIWRRGSDSNRRMMVLQTIPLGIFQRRIVVQSNSNGRNARKRRESNGISSGDWPQS